VGDALREGCQGADLDHPGGARDRPPVAAEHGPGGVTGMRGGRLCELQSEALADDQEAVQESTWQLDVVVDHDQPAGVAARRERQHLVEVLELPPAAKAADARVWLEPGCGT